MVEISVAVIAAAFVALVVYAIITLRSVSESVRQTSQSVHNLERNMEQVSEEAVKLLRSTTELTDDLNLKMKQVDGFVESVGNVGQAVQQVTSSVRQVSATVTRSFTNNIESSIHNNKYGLDEILQMTNAAAHLWQKLKSLKSKQ